MIKEYIKARLILSDLIEIDRQFEITGFGGMSGMLLFKQTLISIANLVDFELSIRLLYKEAPELSADYKKISKELQFSKYLRNKFVGHIKPELLEKALEWKPELKLTLGRSDNQQVSYFFNIWVLETAINSYVDVNGGHQLFESETDLNYPPDMERFLIFLTKIIKSSINYINDLIVVLSKKIEVDKVYDEYEKMQLWIEAGKTDFEFIRK
ncbi:hypothetical protein I5501_13940 [Citrobacter freundii]|nr:hypothetical protein [Citrobacter freundii]